MIKPKLKFKVTDAAIIQINREAKWINSDPFGVYDYTDVGYLGDELLQRFLSERTINHFIHVLHNKIDPANPMYIARDLAGGFWILSEKPSEDDMSFAEFENLLTSFSVRMDDRDEFDRHIETIMMTLAEVIIHYRLVDRRHWISGTGDSFDNDTLTVIGHQVQNFIEINLDPYVVGFIMDTPISAWGWLQTKWRFEWNIIKRDKVLSKYKG